jgi:integrase
LAQSTLTNYADTVRLHLKPGLGDIRLARIVPADVDAFIASKREQYAANSLRLMRSTLRQALSDAERKGLVSRNAVALSEPIHVSRRAMKWLDEKEARSLLDQVHGDPLEALYVVCLSLGLRRGEALGLQWDDVDLGKGTVLIRRALRRVQVPPLSDGSYPDGRKTALVVGDVKTEDSCRTQNLPNPVVEALREHRIKQRTDQLAATSWESGTFVFTTPVGTPIDPSNFAKLLSAHCVKAGLGHRNPHQLRHSAASILLAQGIPLHEVSDFLGHSSVRITKDVYGHLSADRRRAAASAVGEALWGASSESEAESG